MIDIYFGSKKITLRACDCKIENNLRNAKLTLSDVDKISEFLKNPTGEDIELSVSNEKKSISFSKFFRYIDAAGGLIRNEQNEYLFIFRRGKWDLPKGKVDKNESLEQAALREVKEECGLKTVKVTGFLTTTFHIYPMKEEFALKATHWYLMSAPCEQKLIPQLEEDITEILWLNHGNIQKVKSNTFSSILEVLDHTFSGTGPSVSL